MTIIITDKLKVDDTLQFYSLSMADPGEGPKGPAPLPPPPLFLDQNEARRAEKIFFSTPGTKAELSAMMVTLSTPDW